jgi:hypothetical protein
MALMFGATERPMADEEGRILPVERHGVKLMSMGLLLEEDSPAVLRGPMVTRYTQQFLRNVLWNDGGDLDILILDLPPGTGDIQLTIVQTVSLAGAVIVTTPQEVALIDARKAVSMFHKVNVPVLGLVENMSYFLCPSDGKRYDIDSPWVRAEVDRVSAAIGLDRPIDELFEDHIVLDPEYFGSWGGLGGALYGATHPAWRSGPFHSPAYNNPLRPWLWRVGASVHPGGGIPAVLGGALSSTKRLLARLG